MTKPKVLITGASSGLGLALAKRLNQDYCLILHASKEENIKELREGNYVLAADFSNPDELNEFCKKLKKDHGDDLFAVINNAGITIDKPLVFQPERDIDKMLMVNLKAPIMITKTVIKLFGLKKRGVVIQMSSCVAETGNAFQSVYSAAKAGLIAFTKSIAKEVANLYDNHRIRVLSVSPGFIETPMTDAVPQTEKEKYLTMIPAQRFGKPEEVAETIAFLLSEKASYINGSNIDINGGLF
ncbi:short-chain dehydrogenase/reductase SDR [Pseudopedobacter saltans DSM 12145]|uniref:Short-chain dehydrogenase/reductase SDR n=1 Tax=Pseudopedobacter saltans (strain ATCC 51119 / DSM 12145 / JCM 21818 / CCUG 39354 / LMG 10337 / NBRC 100064 / NCIMB 13643) TaxID=762903 RepID=F0S818_PSESL|nr:SDR family oxidoreductase [Pseudopedobacter saltans]ADY51239.1 short-chain dehydrogenase/reductase SDR [Pseudopedobacter saltans DSM 12145]